eukprot:1160513-Pelagomonas_calceolata.AAC.17
MGGMADAQDGKGVSIPGMLLGRTAAILLLREMHTAAVHKVPWPEVTLALDPHTQGVCAHVTLWGGGQTRVYVHERKHCDARDFPQERHGTSPRSTTTEALFPFINGGGGGGSCIDNAYVKCQGKSGVWEGRGGCSEQNEAYSSVEVALPQNTIYMEPRSTLPRVAGARDRSDQEEQLTDQQLGAEGRGRSRPGSQQLGMLVPTSSVRFIQVRSTTSSAWVATAGIA